MRPVGSKCYAAETMLAKGIGDMHARKVIYCAHYGYLMTSSVTSNNLLMRVMHCMVIKSQQMSAHFYTNASIAASETPTAVVTF